jgi:hypothetical protein
MTKSSDSRKQRRQVRQTLSDGRVVDVIHSPDPAGLDQFLTWALQSQDPEAVAFREHLKTRDLSNYSPPDTLVVRPMEDEGKPIDPALLKDLPRVRQ